MMESIKTLLNGLRTRIESLALRVRTAQTTADTAQTTADTAQTTADTAQTTAENAQTAAENAQTAAEKANQELFDLMDAGYEWGTSNMPRAIYAEYATGFFRCKVDGVVYRSRSGSMWVVDEDVPAGVTSIYGVDGVWFAFADKPYYSLDGTSWRVCTGLPPGSSYGIWHAGGLWFAFAAGHLYWSENLDAWDASDAFEPGGPANAVTYGAGVWVFCATFWPQYSTDGKTWSPCVAVGNQTTAVYANGMWAGGGGYGGQGLYYSVDGKAWEQSNVTDGNTYELAFVHDRWFAICESYKVYTSTDGKTWTRVPELKANYVPVYANGVFVCADGSACAPLVSYDGVEWYSSSAPASVGSVREVHITPDGSFMCLSTSGILRSVDGRNWSVCLRLDTTGGVSLYFGDNSVVASVFAIDKTLYSARKVVYDSVLTSHDDDPAAHADIREAIGALDAEAVGAMPALIPSSTAGSTKKFKITVDDTGALTATEVE